MRGRSISLALLVVASLVPLLTYGASAIAPRDVRVATTLVKAAGARASFGWCHPDERPWPKWLPDDLAFPKGTYRTRSLGRVDGYYRALFLMPVSTKGFARFIFSTWPAAGWTIGGGETEPGEMEYGFFRGSSSGAFKAQDINCVKRRSNLFIVYNPVGVQPSPSPSPSTSAL